MPMDNLQQALAQAQNPAGPTGPTGPPGGPPMMGNGMGPPGSPSPGGAMPQQQGQMNPQQMAMMKMKMDMLRNKVINSGGYVNGIRKEVFELLDPETQNQIKKSPLDIKYKIWDRLEHNTAFKKAIKTGDLQKMKKTTEAYLEMFKLLKQKEEFKGLDAMNAENPPPIGSMGRPGGTPPDQPTSIGSITNMV